MVESKKNVLDAEPAVIPEHRGSRGALARRRAARQDSGIGAAAQHRARHLAVLPGYPQNHVDAAASEAVDEDAFAAQPRGRAIETPVRGSVGGHIPSRAPAMTWE